jgi:hypothetical protein
VGPGRGGKEFRKKKGGERPRSLRHVGSQMPLFLRRTGARSTHDTELWVRVHAPGPGISFPSISWARICRGNGGQWEWGGRILHALSFSCSAETLRTCVGPQSCFAGSLGSWAPGSSWDQKHPEDFNATWLPLRTLTTGTHC